jgi:hypothetical protein
LHRSIPPLRDQPVVQEDDAIGQRRRLMTDEQRALEFADKLCSSAMNVVAASAGPTDKWNRDPKIIGLTILCCTLSTFKAALILVRAGQVMEARMLARPLYENCLWIAALIERRTN